MPEFTPEERALLERFAPKLQYDAQDAFRAVDAATMTDNPPNLLRRGDGRIVAGHGDLNLDCLTAYPGGGAAAKGDHLAAGPRLLEDAVELQSRYAHCVYGRVLPDGGDPRWLQYWIWYYDNPKTFLGRGRHEGDWELVQVGLRDGEPETVTLSQHGHGEALTWADAHKDGDHPVVYVAPFSHANYPKPGTRFYFPAADHPSDRGPAAVPEVHPFGTWQAWQGRWGADIGMLGGRLRKLGGVSPDSPVAQRMRWTDPEGFWNAARRHNAVFNALKQVVWFVGKAFYPLPPELVSVRLDGRRLEVRWRLRETLLRRSRDVLVTVCEGPDEDRMVLSAVRRKRDARAGAAWFHLPAGVESCTVRMSAFNRVGQRSDSSDPMPSVSGPLDR
jgi:hypothetical protein